MRAFENQMGERRSIGEYAAFWRTCPLDLHADDLLDALEGREAAILAGTEDRIIFKRTADDARVLKNKFDGDLKLAKNQLTPIAQLVQRHREKLHSRIATLTRMFQRAHENLGEAHENAPLAHPPP